MKYYAFYRDVYHVDNHELLKKVDALTEQRILKKGEHLINIEEDVKDIYILKYGLTRGYFIDANGTERTDCFSFRSGSSAMPCELGLDYKAPIAIEALEESSFLCISIAAMLSLSERYQEVMMVYNQLLVHALNEHRKLKQVLHEYTASQRYRWFLKEYPGLIHRVKGKHIASFLNMTPETLSRMRKDFGS